MGTTADERRLQIGAVAERAGINAKTIRYYEDVGLLAQPERSSSGYRLYREADVERLRFIKRVQRLAFPLGEIREILGLRDRGEPPCSYVAERLDRRAGEIDRQIKQLERLKEELAELRGRARRLAPHDPEVAGYCHILEPS